MVAEQEILGQLGIEFFGDHLVNYLLELDEKERFFEVIGP